MIADFIERRPFLTPFAKVSKDDLSTGDDYQFENTLLTKEEYCARVNYESYFRLMGVPYLDSARFHERILRKDLKGAIEAIRPHFRESNAVKNVRYIKQHLQNAIDRFVS